VVEGKTIGGILLLLLAVGIFFIGQNVAINEFITGGIGAGIGLLLGGPIGALLGAVFGVLIAEFVIKVFISFIALWTAFAGVLVLILSEDRVWWLVGFWFFSTLLIINLVVPDPIPIIDEALMGIVAMLFGIKTIAPEAEPVRKITDGEGFF